MCVCLCVYVCDGFFIFFFFGGGRGGKNKEAAKMSMIVCICLVECLQIHVSFPTFVWRQKSKKISASASSRLFLSSSSAK